MINVLSKEMTTLEVVELPQIVYKYRNWGNPDRSFHDNILLRNEYIYPTPMNLKTLKIVVIQHDTIF